MIEQVDQYWFNNSFSHEGLIPGPSTCTCSLYLTPTPHLANVLKCCLLYARVLSRSANNDDHDRHDPSPQEFTDECRHGHKSTFIYLSTERLSLWSLVRPGRVMEGTLALSLPKSSYLCPLSVGSTGVSHRGWLNWYLCMYLRHKAVFILRRGSLDSNFSLKPRKQW